MGITLQTFKRLCFFSGKPFTLNKKESNSSKKNKVQTDTNQCPTPRAAARPVLSFGFNYRLHWISYINKWNTHTLKKSEGKKGAIQVASALILGKELSVSRVPAKKTRINPSFVQPGWLCCCWTRGRARSFMNEWTGPINNIMCVDLTRRTHMCTHYTF